MAHGPTPAITLWITNVDELNMDLFMSSNWVTTVFKRIDLRLNDFAQLWSRPSNQIKPFTDMFCSVSSNRLSHSFIHTGLVWPLFHTTWLIISSHMVSIKTYSSMGGYIQLVYWSCWWLLADEGGSFPVQELVSFIQYSLRPKFVDLDYNTALAITSWY